MLHLTKIMTGTKSIRAKSELRREFRTVLGEIVKCVRSNLEVPGVSPFQPHELVTWFGQITEEDIRAVWDEQSPKQ